MRKKLGLIAGMALAALAFAIPVSAASANWTHETVPITNNETMHLTGTMGFDNGAGTGFDCEVTANLEMTAGTTAGHVRNFTVFTNTCVGKGVFVNCKVKSATPAGEPWAAAIVGGTVRINGFDLTNVYENCPAESTTIIDNGAPEVIATPDNNEAIESLKITGTAAGGLNITGTLAPTILGTWGIE